MENLAERINSHLTPQRQRFFLIGLLIIFASALSYQINRPFTGDNDELNGMNGISASNWIQEGPWQLKFTQKTLFAASDAAKDVDTIYLNHPNFLILPLYISYSLFGFGEWQTRLVPIFFSLLSLAAFWFLIDQLFKKPWLTLTSSFFFAIFPLNIYYGRLMTHEPLNLFFTLALFLFVARFEENPTRKNLIGICAASFMGGITDWPFLFPVAAAWVYVALKENYPRRKEVLVWIPISVALAVSVTLLQIWSIAHENPISFLKRLYLRKHVESISLFPFLTFSFWRLTFDSRGFTDIGLILGIVGLILYLRTNWRERGRVLQAICLLSAGFFTYLLFYPTATTHGFSGLYFVPFWALMAGWALYKISKAWQVYLLTLIFVSSSVLYTSNLYAIHWFSPDDFPLIKEVAAAAREGKPICTDGLSTTNITVYLYPRHEILEPPCAGAEYFILQHPEGLYRRSPAPHVVEKLLKNSFGENVDMTSFTVASIVEAVKKIPPLREKFGGAYRDPESKYYYATLAERMEKFISDAGLKPVKCTTNYCQYESSFAR